jgi:6-phosphofructokinase
VQVIDKSCGFDTTVEEVQRALNAAHVEAESVDNDIGVVKLMGGNSCMFISLFKLTATSAVNSSIFCSNVIIT